MRSADPVRSFQEFRAVSEVQPIPEGSHGLIPHLVVADGARALEFYKRAFGAEVVALTHAPDGKKIMHAELRMGESAFYVCDDFLEWGGRPRTPAALGGTAVTLHSYVLDTDAAIERALSAGARVRIPAQDMFWGDRYGVVTDPFGHEWSFATRQRDVPREEVERGASEALAGEAGGK